MQCACLRLLHDYYMKLDVLRLAFKFVFGFSLFSLLSVSVVERQQNFK